MVSYQNLDKIIKISVFSGPKRRDSQAFSFKPCAHVYSLTRDGYNTISNKRNQRIKCVKCNKRFGNKITMHELLAYQQKIKKILFELFILKFPVTGTALRWGIPQDKLSRFKKRVVSHVFHQNSDLIEHELKTLPRGAMLADETFMGFRGNSHVEIVVINNIFEILATGPVNKGDLKNSIVHVFKKIPESCRKKLKVLITDGEPSYSSIAKEFGGGIVHLAQLHSHDQRGKIIINKFKKLGPHHLHYKIKTHWKAFRVDKHELKFKWEIKLIKGKTHATRGSPPKPSNSHSVDAKWRKTLKSFQTGAFKKNGTARLYINFKTNKLSLRAGSSKWMVTMLLPLFKIFKGKHVTTNLIESKHSQIKRKGAGRKQQDEEYAHQLFALHAFLAEHGHFPFTILSGRPLYCYLMKKNKKKETGYKCLENSRRSVQTVLTAHV